MIANEVKALKPLIEADAGRGFARMPMCQQWGFIRNIFVVI
jgi:hypothetical protein